MGFITAFKFLTIFPLPQTWQSGKMDYGRSLIYFPLVGLLLGVILSLVYYGLLYILPYSLVCVLLLIALTVMTGANHLDGLMDTFDGIVSGKSRERRLEIMADTRVGAFGITAAIFTLLLKYVALTSLDRTIVIPALLLMPVLSRWVMVGAITAFPYVRNAGLGLEFKRGSSWKKVAIATAFSLLISLLLLKVWSIALMVVLGLIAWGIAYYFSSRLGGLTGDVYGALNEISEVLVLVALLLFWRL